MVARCLKEKHSFHLQKGCFYITIKHMRINKYLATCGLCSRRKAEEYITAGKVKINGQVVTNLATDISEFDKVEVGGRKENLPDEKLYYMVNKPVGYVTTTNDPFKRVTVMKLLPRGLGRLYPVGRLDFNTSGLLLFTNDGEFANKIMHPSKEIIKKYEVRLTKDLTAEQIKKIEGGIVIDDRKTSKSKIQCIKNIGIEKASVIIEIHEGRNREVRKMFEAVGNKVCALRRIQIGKLELGGLESGKSRKLKEEDLKLIFK